MNYKELYENAVKSGAIKDLTPKFHTWQKPGEVVIGRYVDSIDVGSSLNEGSYKQYIFETDEGLVKFALGSATDKEIFPLLKKGAVYVVAYKGKEKIAGGRQINRFEVKLILDESGGVSDDDIPF